MTTVKRRRPKSKRVDAATPEKAPAAPPKKKASTKAGKSARSGKIWAQRMYKVSQRVEDESADNEEIAVAAMHPDVPAAVVKVSGGTTINMGQFESLRIDVGVELPCYPEEIQECYEAALGFVSVRIEEESLKARKQT